MKKRLLYILLALLTVVNLTAFGTMTYHRCCHNEKECIHSENEKGVFLCQELSLNQQQAKAMEILSKKFHLFADSISSDLTVKRAELIKLLSVSKTKTNEIDNKLDEINRLQAELQKRSIQYLINKKEKLTPEQQKKFFAILSERFEKESKCKYIKNYELIEDKCKTNIEQLNNCPNNN